MARFNILKVKGRYPGNYFFFDKVNVFFGNLRLYNPNEKFNPSRFKNKVDSAYDASLSLLQQYQNQKLVSDSFAKYAKIKLLNDYVYTLLDPLYEYDRDILPKNFFDKIINLDFSSDEYAENISKYVRAAYIYNIYFLNNFDRKNVSANFNNGFKHAYHYFKGVVKDRLLGWYITDNIDKEIISFDSLYKVFLNICSTSYIRNEVQAKVEAYYKKQKEKPPFDTVFENTYVFNTKGEKIKFKNINYEQRYVFIDVWASWCNPCITEIPFTKRLENRFKEKIVFIFMSIDEKEINWKKSLDKLMLSGYNNFNLFEGVNSMFARYFDIISIPRYLLLDLKNGKVIHKNLPPPSSKNFSDYLSELTGN